jgi:O-methyltransferase
VGITAEIGRQAARVKAAYLRQKYRDHSMITRGTFIQNLMLCRKSAPKSGCIIECGVWRGGMSAAMADMLPGRRHYLFDSFEGLPPAKDIDGASAIAWQRDVGSPAYFDNCRAERSFAETAMRMSAAGRFELVQGWFSQTLPGFVPEELIAVLRLDGDWYESTMDCLNALYPHVAEGGLVIIDDYYAWDGCARAVHDYLSAHKLADRIRNYRGVCHIVRSGS